MRQRGETPSLENGTARATAHTIGGKVAPHGVRPNQEMRRIRLHTKGHVIHAALIEAEEENDDRVGGYRMSSTNGSQRHITPYETQRLKFYRVRYLLVVNENVVDLKWYLPGKT